MNDAFQFCVDILRVWAEYLGITYEEINIYLFVIIHPAITLIFFCLFIRYFRKHQKHSLRRS